MLTQNNEDILLNGLKNRQTPISRTSQNEKEFQTLDSVFAEQKRKERLKQRKTCPLMMQEDKENEVPNIQNNHNIKKNNNYNRKSEFLPSWQNAQKTPFNEQKNNQQNNFQKEKIYYATEVKQSQKEFQFEQQQQQQDKKNKTENKNENNNDLNQNQKQSEVKNYYDLLQNSPKNSQIQKQSSQKKNSSLQAQSSSFKQVKKAVYLLVGILISIVLVLEVFPFQVNSEQIEINQKIIEIREKIEQQKQQQQQQKSQEQQQQIENKENDSVQQSTIQEDNIINNNIQQQNMPENNINMDLEVVPISGQEQELTFFEPTSSQSVIEGIGYQVLEDLIIYTQEQDQILFNEFISYLESEFSRTTINVLIPVISQQVEQSPYVSMKIIDENTYIVKQQDKPREQEEQEEDQI